MEYQENIAHIIIIIIIIKIICKPVCKRPSCVRWASLSLDSFYYDNQ